MELNKKAIVLDKRIGKENTQILVEGDIIVPDVKPDLELVLKTDADVFIDSRDILNERVNFKGKLMISALYLSKGEEKSVHSMSAEGMLNDFVTIDGVDNSMWVDVKCNITNIDYKIINERKLSYRAVVDVAVDVISPTEYMCVVGIDDIPESQQRKKKMKLDKVVTNKPDRFIIKEEVSIPSTKPNIQEILQMSMRIANKDIKVGTDKVSVAGEMLVTTLYKSEEDGLIELVESEIPFNGVLEAEGADDTMAADVDIYIQDKYYHVLPDSDGENRGIEIEASVGANVKVCCESSFEVLEDTYCINKSAEITDTDVKYPSLMCRNKSQCPVKEVINIDETSPKMLQIFKASGKPYIDDINVIDDKVIVEGIVNVDILYVTGNDQGNIPIYCYSGAVPFKQVVEARGVKSEENNNVDVSAELEHIGFNMLSDREVEVRCVLDFNTVVTREVEDKLVTDVEFKELEPSYINAIASITIYIVKPGDTLWKIAKRFNTSIDELVYLNDIEDADLIYPGQRLLILKKVY